MKLIRAVGAGVSLFVLIYISCIGIKNIFRYNKLNLEYEKLRTDYKVAYRENLHLKKQIEEMKDTGYWELKAKQRLGYTYKHEKMVKVVVKD